MHDLRVAIRSLAKDPSFTTVVVLTLALGVGAATAIFSVVHGVLIRSAPFPHSDRMVMTPQVMEGTGFRRWYWSYPNYRDLLEQATSFETLERVYLGTVVLTGRDEPRRMFVRYVTPGFLDLHGARPVLGRNLGPEDDRLPGGHPAVVITHGLWQSYFGGEPNVIGTTVSLSGTPYTVVGVLNPEFEYPFGQDIGSVVDLWLPAMMTGQAHPRGDALFSERESGALSLIGALADGVSIEEAQAEMDLIATTLAREHPDVNGGYGISVLDWNEMSRGPARGPLVVLFGGSVVLLLVGCFNIANLMLVRGAVRRRELAVRLALAGIAVT